MLQNVNSQGGHQAQVYFWLQRCCLALSGVERVQFGLTGRMPWKSSRRVATTLLCACARLQLQGNDELTNETMKSSLRKSTLASWFLHLHPCLGYAVTSDGLPRLVSARMPEAERLQLAAGMLSGRLVFRTLLSSFRPSVLPSIPPCPSFLRSRSLALSRSLSLSLSLSLALSALSSC